MSDTLLDTRFPLSLSSVATNVAFLTSENNQKTGRRLRGRKVKGPENQFSHSAFHYKEQVTM